MKRAVGARQRSRRLGSTKGSRREGPVRRPAGGLVSERPGRGITRMQIGYVVRDAWARRPTDRTATCY